MSTQESKDALLHISSILDSTTETRIIRSHRRLTHHRPRKVVAVLVLALMVGSASAVSDRSSAESVPVGLTVTANALVLTPYEAPQRADMPASRSARAAASRTTRINRAINFAMAQRGDRYRWGAAGPSRWDCSGLVMKSFAKAGVSLPHYTGALLKKGKRVSRSGLQRGDLIFPSRGHVGIYLGGGQMIAASSGKGKVVVQKVYGFYTARRVL